MLLLYNYNSKFMQAKNSPQRLLYIDRKLSLITKTYLEVYKEQKVQKGVEVIFNIKKTNFPYFFFSDSSTQMRSLYLR